MTLAHTLIIETGQKEIRIPLHVPMDLFEIRDWLSDKRLFIALASNGVARVSFS